MPQAKFQSAIGSPVIDEAAGVIRGCRIATLGAVSIASEKDGAGMVMDSTLIGGLLKCAKDNGDRVPVFHTHGWYDDDKNDPLTHDVGVWNDFALDPFGNLTATFTAFETEYKAGIFSRAKNDPQGIAVSPIFDYSQRNGDKRFCDPTKFISADFVKSGAINKALFSADQTQPNASMDIPEFLTMLSDPAVKTAIKAIIESHDDAADQTEADSAEADAGVTEADKKPEDDNMPALMRAARRINRCNARLTKSLAADKTAILAEAKVQAAAETTALLGKGGFIRQGGDPAIGNDFDNAVKAELAANPGIGIGRAKFNVGRKNPELYAKHTSKFLTQ